jgi:uncharacterized protein (TIGR02231 family)
VRVTLFEDRAEVVRAIEVELPAGVARVTVAGVSPFVDERSVQARFVGGADAGSILSARVRYRAHAEAALGREAIEALEAEARQARRRHREAVEAYGRAEAGHARTRSARRRWLEGVGTVPARAREAERLAEWRASLAALDAAEDALLDAQAKARRGQVEAADEQARTEARLAAGRVEAPRYEAAIELEVDASAEGAAALEVTYRVPAALWRPEHVVRLVDPEVSGGSAALEIVTHATAWQRTGEAWDDVEVRFSTARPARAASPPLLTDDVVASRRKAPEERRRIAVDLREQAIRLAGVAGGARAVDEMPGVDDGGEPVTFAPKGKVSIASDGRPFRVEVGRRTLEAKIDRVVLPEVAKAAHLRATATLGAGGPLLAGPVRIARGASLVGRAKLAFVGAGEPFEIGLGPDDGLRVRRVQSDKRDTVPVTGTQRLERAVSIHLSNLSGEPKHAIVTERVPVSELEEVEVVVLEPGGFRGEGPDGICRCIVELAPDATRTLELRYEIRAAAKVILPM